MRRHLFAICVGIVAFGLGAVTAILLGQRIYREDTKVSPVVAEQFPPAAKPTDCKDSNSYPGISRPVSELKKYKNGYFPVGAFDDGWQNDDDGKNAWYGKALRVINEKSLLDRADDSTEIYRFLWMRTFDHPVSVRFERIGYSFRLSSAETSGMGGYEPGRKWRTDNDIPVTEEEWCHFISLLENASFWRQESNDRDIGNDGSQWVLEGLRRNRYHLVDRWSPQSGGYREACTYLLKLSGRDPEKIGNGLY